MFKFLILLLFGFTAHAQEATISNELRANAAAYLSFDHESSVSGNPAEDTTYISFGGDYGHFFDANWELLGSLLYSSTSGTASTSSFTPMIGAAYNIGADALNAFFVRAAIGENFSKTSTSHNYTAFQFDVAAGKRIGLSSSVSWTPEVGYSSRAEAADGTWHRAAYSSLRVVPFQLSYLF